jgi:hypothetical protein
MGALRQPSKFSSAASGAIATESAKWCQAYTPKIRLNRDGNAPSRKPSTRVLPFRHVSIEKCKAAASEIKSQARSRTSPHEINKPDANMEMFEMSMIHSGTQTVARRQTAKASTTEVLP